MTNRLAATGGAVAAEATAFFQLRNIGKVYRTDEVETIALAGIDLDVQEGEFVTVMGPSGCGKSTLLNIVAMLDSPTSGRYVLGGVDVSAATEPQLAEIRRGNIGFVFQSFMLIDNLTVHENVELPLHCLKISRLRRQSRVREILELVDLQDRARQRPAQLSGGQQQRVAIARALVCDPRLLVADEPTGNLDRRQGDDIMDMLATLHQQGTTILMVTHSPAHAGAADRILHMLDGRLTSDSSRATL